MSLGITDLEVWKKARVFRNEISKLSKSFPIEEKYKLVDQIIRSSRSISANIAEGHGRFHFQENIQFCRTARGSLLETFDHLTVALDEGYLSEDNFIIYNAQYEELIKMLNGYITYLKKRKEEERKQINQSTI
ncbi:MULTISPECIES: four helix bundle protein [unclassified Ekhidna]|uniref:four helix bundle protein n=1 Tax=unclassified Ekhidna TaxID=2632188 RepID=UPI0032DEF351